MLLAILLYIICLLLIFLYKPAMMFDAAGNLKHFGYDENDVSASLLNIELVLIFLAIFCYFVIIAVELAAA
jgi:Ca2+/Na+ antiporter